MNDVAKHYDILIDEGQDPVYDPKPLQDYMDKWDGQSFIDKMQLDKTKSVLEIGVGTGRIAVRVAHFCKKFTGIDISTKTIRKARENIKNANLICGDFLDYGFSETFDVIYSSLTFLHIKEKQRAFDTVRHLLNKGGRFVLSIDKNQDEVLDTGSSKIRIYPDNPECIKECAKKSGLMLLEQTETEFADIFVFLNRRVVKYNNFLEAEIMKYDLVVAGGGISGVAAAVSAAREGLKVLLVEKSGCLGGAISNCLVYPFMPYWTKLPEGDASGNKKYLSQGIFKEMKQRNDKYVSDCNEKEFNSEYFKIVLDDMTTEAGVDVLFHGVVYGVKKQDRQITEVEITAKSQRLTVRADFFVDATGDGDLFYLAGCDYQLGRESDGLCQPMTTCFRMSGVDLDLFTEDRPRLQQLYKEKRAKGELKNPREDILVFFGVGEDVLHFNSTRVIKLDPTDPFDISRAEVVARRQIHELISFLKEHSKAFDESALISIAVNIGVRESRKLKGVHILTGDELIACTRFEDSVALGNYDIDIHNPAGSGTSHRYFKDGEYYTIPYRSLLPKEFDNLLVAGRCLSATHEAQASVRIMPICCCLGQAAGTAAAVALKSHTNAHNVDVKSLQKKLLENGAAL